MVGNDKLFTGSIPEIYDRFMVPLIFAAYADVLAERLAQVKPQDVLETAAGTGVLTRAIASRLAASVRIVATDLNQPMLDRAAMSGTMPAHIILRQANALALPFRDQSFDVVACQFGAMFFSDRIKGYREALRVLRPGGSFLFNVWDRIDANAFPDVVSTAVATLFPCDPPTFMARIPHGYHDVDLIRSELSQAGFVSASVETVDKTSKATTPQDVSIAFCQGTPLRTEIVTRDATRLDEATKVAADALALRFGSGPIEGPIRAHVITAVR